VEARGWRLEAGARRQRRPNPGPRTEDSDTVQLYPTL
jgi:hypothetical protein